MHIYTIKDSREYRCQNMTAIFYPRRKSLTPKQRFINIFYVPESGMERSNK